MVRLYQHPRTHRHAISVLHAPNNDSFTCFTHALVFLTKHTVVCRKRLLSATDSGERSSHQTTPSMYSLLRMLLGSVSRILHASRSIDWSRAARGWSCLASRRQTPSATTVIPMIASSRGMQCVVFVVPSRVSGPLLSCRACRQHLRCVPPTLQQTILI